MVEERVGVTDPTPANNSATDTDSVLQPGVLGVAPANLDFGTITVGSSSASQSITLSNSGGSPLQVTAISAAVAPFAAIGGSCGAVPFSIGTGLSCTLNQPRSVPPRQGRLPRHIHPNALTPLIKTPFSPN